MLQSEALAFDTSTGTYIRRGGRLQRFIVFDFLGTSLEDLFGFCRRTFPLKILLMVADQLIYRLNYIHSKHDNSLRYQTKPTS